MRATQLFAPTLREAPKDAELVSHQLLLRGGFIRSLASGVYSYLPLGLRVLNKVSNICRTEMSGINGAEFLMPALVPPNLLAESGRDKVDVLFHVKEHDYILGFTHEEVVTDIVRSDVQSYKQLPLIAYQIQNKFRNEPRPRGGLMRGREFLMLDAYSFDRDAEGAEKSFFLLRDTFARMFAACGLEALSVDADSGAMGGTQSAEFMVLSGDGEDTVLRDDAGYAANAERCEAIPAPLEDQSADVPAMERITTPGKTTIEDVSVFLGVPSYRLIKSLVVVGADGKPALALVRGDREIHEAKLSKALGGTAVLAEASVVERVTGAPVGFAGPVGLAQPVRVIADREVEFVRDGVVGANAADAHLVHVLPGRDFPHPEYLDLRTAVEGDVSPANPDHKLLTQRGIEVGHVFNLGTRYSDPMKATFNDDDGTVRPIMMGCYGIGVSRTVAAAVEQSHDDGGIVWPITIAPFEVVIMLLNAKDDVQRQAAESLYTELKKAGVDVLLDDRDERPGSKFKDADLIGYPVQVVVGKGLAEGNLEMSLRRAKGEKKVVPVGEAATVIAQTVADLKAEIAAAVA
jgi:prolyl-tRNA synthetase